MITNFLDLYIPQRYTEIMENPEPRYIHQLIAKHLYLPVSISERLYKVNINNKVTYEVTISGNYENMYNLYEHLSRYNVKFRSLTQTSLAVEIGDFIRKIY